MPTKEKNATSAITGPASGSATCQKPTTAHMLQSWLRRRPVTPEDQGHGPSRHAGIG